MINKHFFLPIIFLLNTACLLRSMEKTLCKQIIEAPETRSVNELNETNELIKSALINWCKQQFDNFDPNQYKNHKDDPENDPLLRPITQLMFPKYRHQELSYKMQLSQIPHYSTYLETEEGIKKNNSKIHSNTTNVPTVTLRTRKWCNQDILERWQPKLIILYNKNFEAAKSLFRLLSGIQISNDAMKKILNNNGFPTDSRTFKDQKFKQLNFIIKAMYNPVYDPVKGKEITHMYLCNNPIAPEDVSQQSPPIKPIPCSNQH